MTVARMVAIACFLAAIGISIVMMRVDQARTARRIQELQFEQTDLKREIWRQEMELARLRSPQMIRERADRMGVAMSSEPES